jgi:O-antigen ligase
MLLLLVLVSNLFEKKAHIKIAVWTIMAALIIKALYGTYHLLFVLKGDLSNVESLTTHQAALHLSVVVVLAVAFWLFQVDWRKQLLLFSSLPPVLLTIIAGQRRSAFVALFIAMALMAVILFLKRRRTFWLIVPPIAVLGLAYMGIFWNSSHPLAGPAQAVKSVVAENQADFHDRASNDYRKIENYNSTFTIKTEPLTGVGFGKKFYIVIPMPDISSFTWWEYIPHNSIVYIWIKSGVGGFIALFLLIGLSIAHGMRATMRLTSPYMRAITLTAVLFVIMHFVYAYVDISWEAQGMIMLGVMLGILNTVEPIVEVDPKVPKRRWPWQPKTRELLPLLPLPSKML